MNQNNSAQVTDRQAHIDQSLIQANLKLTPRERLEQLEGLLNDMARIRNAVHTQL